MFVTALTVLAAVGPATLAAQPASQELHVVNAWAYPLFAFHDPVKATIRIYGQYAPSVMR